MPTQEFESGAQVILQSGGPYMTVERCDKGQVVCVWFAGDELKRGSFPAAALKPREAQEAMIVARRSRFAQDLEDYSPY